MASKHSLAFSYVCLVDGVEMVGHGTSRNQLWCRLPVSKLQKTVALVDFLCVMANFCQWCVCVIEIQVLSTHVFIYSKMMRHTTKTAFWFILGTNILASHHINAAAINLEVFVLKMGQNVFFWGC